MALVEPVPDEPAATLDLAGETALAVADYHAGIEEALRYERGVELRSRADDRRERLLSLVERTDADRVVVLGDLVHRISAPAEAELEEVDALLRALSGRDVPLTLVQGNHDGGVADTFGDRMDVLPVDGTRRGDVGLVHGHTWPAEDVLTAETVCIGHEHPAVRLQDTVGGSQVEKAWLRGSLEQSVFAEGLEIPADDLSWNDPELVVFPAFNERSGGTWVNVEGQEFLSPFLPDGLRDGRVYLLDGTALGDYQTV